MAKEEPHASLQDTAHLSVLEQALQLLDCQALGLCPHSPVLMLLPDIAVQGQQHQQGVLMGDKQQPGSIGLSARLPVAPGADTAAGMFPHHVEAWEGGNSALYGRSIIDLPVSSIRERSGAESLSLALLDVAGGSRAVTCKNLALHVA